jgi:hypothetical protein
VQPLPRGRPEPPNLARPVAGRPSRAGNKVSPSPREKARRLLGRTRPGI